MNLMTTRHPHKGNKCYIMYRKYQTDYYRLNDRYSHPDMFYNKS